MFWRRSSVIAASLLSSMPASASASASAFTFALALALALFLALFDLGSSSAAADGSRVYSGAVRGKHAGVVLGYGDDEGL